MSASSLWTSCSDRNASCAQSAMAKPMLICVCRVLAVLPAHCARAILSEQAASCLGTMCCNPLVDALLPGWRHAMMPYAAYFDRASARALKAAKQAAEALQQADELSKSAEVHQSLTLPIRSNYRFDALEMVASGQVALMLDIMAGCKPAYVHVTTSLANMHVRTFPCRSSMLNSRLHSHMHALPVSCDLEQEAACRMSWLAVQHQQHGCQNCQSQCPPSHLAPIGLW